MCGSDEVGKGISLPHVATGSLLCSWREIALKMLTACEGRCEAVDFIRRIACKWNRVQSLSACLKFVMK